MTDKTFGSAQSNNNVEHMNCPGCGNPLEAPKDVFFPDLYKGMRLVEVQARFICEGCGALLKKEGAPTTLEVAT